MMDIVRLLVEALHIPASRAQSNAPAFERACAFAEINTDLRMAHWLAASPAGTLLMCHPGGPPATGDGSDPIASARQWEWAHLASAAFAAQCATAGVELVRGSALYALCAARP